MSKIIMCDRCAAKTERPYIVSIRSLDRDLCERCANEWRSISYAFLLNGEPPVDTPAKPVQRSSGLSSSGLEEGWVAQMKKPMIVMILGAALVWGCTMWIHSARAEEAPKAPEKWKITIVINDPQAGEVKLIYGSKETGAVYFDSEKACTDALKGKEFVAVMKQVQALAAKRKATVEKPICVLDVKLNEI